MRPQSEPTCTMPATPGHVHALTVSVPRDSYYRIVAAHTSLKDLVLCRV